MNSLVLCFFLIFSTFGSVILYPKYYISNFCGDLKGSAIKMGENIKSVAMIKLKRETYKPNMDCGITIKAPVNFGIIAYVKKIKLRKSLSNVEDILTITADNDSNSSLVLLGTNDELTPKINLISKPSKGEISVAFKSKDYYLALTGKGFKIVVTTYTINSLGGKCGLNSSLSYNCANNRCIDKKLECDGINNCGNEYDEHNCGSTSESTIGVFFFITTISVMIILVFVFMCRTKKTRHKIAVQINKVYTTSGRKISNLFAPDIRKLSIDGQNRTQSTQEINYSSVPVICESSIQTQNQFKKVYTNRGRKLPNIFAPDIRKLSFDGEIPTQSTQEINYSSVPIICESNNQTQNINITIQ